MRHLRTPLFLALLAALALPGAAEARRARATRSGASLGLGADYLVDPESGELQLTLAAETSIAPRLTVGARFGAMFLASPDRVGVPIDGRLRLRGGRFYAEGLVGPWIVFDDDDTLRLHAAFGFGWLTRALSFGFEVGWLDPTSMIGVRIAFPI